MDYQIPTLPLTIDLETKPVLRQLILANKKLAELKGISHTIPNENILIDTLVLQEARESSGIENIVTTNDELFRADIDGDKSNISHSTKEVIRYSKALKHGFNIIRKDKLITVNRIIEIQKILEGNDAGFRSQFGTVLKKNNGSTVYTPPQHIDEIVKYMANLEQFINDNTLSDIDPLIKMAIIHHQFESIHPFLDGNGRTGRIINMLYLVTQDLLDIPILYLSRYIIQNKANYYKLLREVQNYNNWEEWVLFMLVGIENTATHTIALVKEINTLIHNFKQTIRPLLAKPIINDLINCLFSHPYTKIGMLQDSLNISRPTATHYLDIVMSTGFVDKVKIGVSNYYINAPLWNLFQNFNEEFYAYDSNNPL